MFELAMGVAVRHLTNHADPKTNESILQQTILLLPKCRTEEEQVVALLFPVVDRGELEVSQLTELDFPYAITSAIRVLVSNIGTKAEQEKEIKKHPIARYVKILQLKAKLEPDYFDKLSEKDRLAVRKSCEASIKILSSKMMINPSNTKVKEKKKDSASTPLSVVTGDNLDSTSTTTTPTQAILPIVREEDEVCVG